MIVPVMFYKVQCDWPECRVDTERLGGEYAAWIDQAQAVDDWTESEGIVLEGTEHTFCSEHEAQFRCPDCSEVAIGFTGNLPDVVPLWRTSGPAGVVTLIGELMPNGRWRCRDCADEQGEDGVAPQ